jgi:hypothetical protein
MNAIVDRFFSDPLIALYLVLFYLACLPFTIQHYRRQKRKDAYFERLRRIRKRKKR